MSTVHRILFCAFGHSRRPQPVRHQTRAQSTSTHQFGSPGVLTCAPWAGLYFEDSNPA
ncbi:MAG: hypothetical protein QOH40_2188 [Arthrobacter pascens]|jgi:hypothetical protein|nr:hypothetical protein [Arthrobacter pascens]